ncbi:MAG: beta-lactamase family protein [Gammaproteobacteria bacterium]|nr:beta-lactamase family protein [Gammaproteobacteria bacterium]
MKLFCALNKSSLEGSCAQVASHRPSKKLRYVILGLFLSMSWQAIADNAPRHFPPGTHKIFISDISGVRSKLLEKIAPIVEKSIDQGLYPGAVILASHRGHIIYRGVFGNRSIIPTVEPMTFRTIFDVASLTKPVVTTTAIMQLVEQGKLDIDLPVGCYWPAFSHNGKQGITTRELLTHTSGLAPDLTFTENIQGKISEFGENDVYSRVEQQHLTHPPGTVFIYSDINFIALGHLVEIISHEPLNDYATKHIFQPLDMDRSFYRPPAQYKNEIAPTQMISGKLRWGQVHDDTVYFMGGVSGMAGLFSDAADLGRFAQCLVNGGRLSSGDKSNSKYLLGPLTILKMITPQTPANMADIHGLGWDIDTRYSNRGILFPINSYGHTGWTGTSLWIDPNTETWLVILTSRTHPSPAPVNPLIHDRKAIANIIAGSIVDISIKNNLKKMTNTGKGELTRAYSPRN